MSGAFFVPFFPPVIPANAGIQLLGDTTEFRKLDASLRWHDGLKCVVAVAGRMESN